MVLAIIAKKTEYSAFKGSYHDYMNLDVTVLEHIWETRRSVEAYQLPAMLLQTLSLSFILPALMCLGNLFGRRNSPVMLPAFYIGVSIVVVDMLFSAGLNTTADWMSSWGIMSPEQAGKHVNDGGFGPLQSLEIAYMLSNSRELWLFTIEWLFLGIGVCSASVTVYETDMFSRWWGHLGVGVSTVAFLEFSFGILRFTSWRTFSLVSMVTEIGLAGVLFPLWTLWMGCELGKYNGNIGGAVADENDSMLNMALEMSRSTHQLEQEGQMEGVVLPNHALDERSPMATV